MIGETNEERFAKPPQVDIPSTPQQIFLKEKELLGFFLTGHPLDSCQQQLRQLSCTPLSQVVSIDHQTVFRTACIVEEIQVKITNKTQRKFAFLTISDGIERRELSVWPDLYEEKSHLIEEKEAVFFKQFAD